MAFSFFSFGNTSTLSIRKIQTLNIDSTINPATFNYLKESFKKNTTPFETLFIVKLNTPGGLVSTTKEIITLIGESDSPIVVWITPEGASATSAGSIIASSAHFLFMTEGTNMGAATPIDLSGEIKESDLRLKSINDLVSLVRSISNARGRNPVPFEEMVTKAKSFSSNEALDLKAINGIANSTQDIIHYLNNKSVTIKGQEFTLNLLGDIKFTEKDMDYGQKLLNILSNPTLSYILFILGAFLIYFEFQTPGGYLAGSLGFLLLILSGISFQVLPVSFGSIALIILAFILFILEFYIPSHGLMSLAGIASFIVGSLFLFRTENSYIDISITVIAASTLAIVLYVFLISTFILKTNKHKKTKSLRKFKTGTIIKILEGGHYQVKISGEIWNARSDHKFNIGDSFKVEKDNHQNLILNIIPKEP